MEKVKVFYNKETDTLDIWFDNPEEEYSCDEIGDGTILKKNKNGKIIGIEKFSVAKSLGAVPPLPFEFVVS
jgi:uncharacterized protein YuzE